MLKILTKIVLYCGLLLHANIVFANADTIYIYADEGVGANSLADTIDFFSKRTSYKVSTIYAVEIISGNWVDKAVLLVIPGGADRFYANKLNGLGNKRIREYVVSGGKFLGICAGAYYASAVVDYARDTQNAIFGTRELKFFPGTSVGPMYQTTTFVDRRDAKVASIVWKSYYLGQPLEVNQEMSVYYFGGGYFDKALQYPGVNILASYDCCQEYPAIISMNVGLGRVVLSAVHFEYIAKYDEEEDKEFRTQIFRINNELENDQHASSLRRQMLFELFTKVQ